MTKHFWDTMAPLYEVFMKKDKLAYKKMYSLIRTKIANKSVLELATGTGLIARNVADISYKMIATDYSVKMIEQPIKKILWKILYLKLQMSLTYNIKTTLSMLSLFQIHYIFCKILKKF